MKNLMNPLPALLVSSLLCVTPALAQQAMTQEEGQATFDAVVAEAAELIKEMRIPGLAVGVIHGPNSYSAGLGVTKVGTDDAVTPETQFQIGSVT